MLEMAEASSGKLTEDLKTAEGLIADKEATLASTQQQLESTRGDLERATRTVGDRENKVGRV